jgi:hypothetical protein
MKNAKATTKGWINPKTGELLKAQKMTQAKADEYNGVVPEPVKPTRTRRAPAPQIVEPQVEEENQIEEVEVAPAVGAVVPNISEEN